MNLLLVKREFYNKFKWHENRSYIFVNNQGKEKVWKWIEAKLKTEKDEVKSKIALYNKKTNQKPSRKLYIRHRYHERVGRLMTNCKLCKSK